MALKVRDISNWDGEHQTLYPRCKLLCEEIVHQLKYIIDKQEIPLAVPLQSRPKEISSIKDKLDKKRVVIKKTLLEMQDLVGIRAITLFKSDSEKIAKLIEEHFDIKNKYYTEDRLEDNEFGYSSIHIVCKLKKSWLDTPSLTGFEDFLIEIQIRTLSQHSWAEASNLFQYKKEDNVPKPLKRSIGRISALLETVDLEFERINRERAEYKIEAQGQMGDRGNDIQLNVDLLREILDASLPKENKQVEDYSSLLENLNVLGYTTIESLKQLIHRRLKNALEEDSRISLGFKKAMEKDPKTTSFESYAIIENDSRRVSSGVYFTHEGLVRQMLTGDLGIDWSTAYTNAKKESKK